MTEFELFFIPIGVIASNVEFLIFEKQKQFQRINCKIRTVEQIIIRINHWFLGGKG